LCIEIFKDLTYISFKHLQEIYAYLKLGAGYTIKNISAHISFLYSSGDNHPLKRTLHYSLLASF